MPAPTASNVIFVSVVYFPSELIPVILFWEASGAAAERAFTVTFTDV